MVKDFFKELRIRISNPLFASFIISWSIINWRVWICLLKYKTDETSLDGFKSPIQLVSAVVTRWSGAWEPLIAAVAYVFLWPIVKNLIQAFNAWIDTRGGNWILRISNKRAVPVEAYVALKASHEEAESALLKELESQSIYKTQTIQLNEELNSLTQKHNEEMAAARRIQNYSDVGFYNGEWDLFYSISGESRTDFVQIHNGEARSTGRDKRLFFRLTRTAYLPLSNEVMITLENHLKMTSVNGTSVSIPTAELLIMVGNYKMDMLTNNIPDSAIDRLVRRRE